MNGPTGFDWDRDRSSTCNNSSTTTKGPSHGSSGDAACRLRAARSSIEQLGTAQDNAKPAAAIVARVATGATPTAPAASIQEEGMIHAV